MLHREKEDSERKKVDILVVYLDGGEGGCRSQFQLRQKIVVFLNFYVMFFMGNTVLYTYTGLHKLSLIKIYDTRIGGKEAA
jgi:hypothetical protein